MATLVLGAAGAAIGSTWFAAGALGMTGAALGWNVGALAGGMLFAPKMPHQYGPRLGDLKIQASTYGNPIPKAFGAVRVAGNVIWAADIVETAHTTSGGKGGGPSSTNYTYTQTFALALCEGEIAGIRKIWANGELIYNIGDDADVSTIVASNQTSSAFTVHTGSETQSPDATIEAYEGAGNVPAYRGLAYIVVVNTSRILKNTNFEFEVIKTGSTANRVDSLTTGSAPGGVVVDSNGRYCYIAQGGANTVRVIDLLTNGTVADITVGTYPVYLALSSDDSRLYVTNYNSDTVSVINTATLTGVATVAVGTKPYSLALSDSYVYVANSESGTGTVSVISRASNTVVATITVGLLPYWVKVDATSTYAYVTTAHGYFHRINISTNTVVETLNLGGTPWDIALDDTYAYLTTYTAGAVKRVRLDTFAYVDQLSVTGSASCIDIDDTYLYVSNYTGADLVVVDKASFAVVSTITDASGVWGVHARFPVCYVTNATTGKLLTVSLADLLTATAEGLDDVVTAICASAGLAAGDIDVTDLASDTVDGYVVQRGTARSQLEQLMQAYYFDAVESDGKVKFVKRGNAAAVTITEDDLAAHEYGSSLPDTLLINRRQEMELPVEVAVQYLDKDAAYAVGSQYAQRLTTDSDNKTSINLAIAMSATKAKQIADVMMYDLWTARTSFDFQTGWKHCYLEPTDVIGVVKDGRTYNIRLTDEDFAITTRRSAVLEDADIYSQSGVAASVPAPAETVASVPLTKLVLLDLPLLRDTDDGVGFYAAACGYADGWLGAQLYKSNDSGATWTSFGNAFLNEATLGTASTVLGTFTGGNVFDETNSVTVTLLNGTLASDTFANVLNGANAALLGDEIIQFREATLTADNTYVLTGLLRGRQGTEWAMGTHAIGDRFVLLDSSTTYIFTGPSSEYDLTRHYRAASFGGYLDDATTQAFANTAVALIPYAPVLLGGGRNAAGDLTLNWTRRTRISGGWNNYSDVPLGEASEAYKVHIYSDSGYATVLRTITGISAQTTSYSAADQTTDFGSPQSTVYWDALQVSATVGDGYAARGAT